MASIWLPFMVACDLPNKASMDSRDTILELNMDSNNRIEVHIDTYEYIWLL